MTARHILILPVFLLTLACQPVNSISSYQASPVSKSIHLLGSNEYIVEQHLVLKNVGSGKPEKQNLWVALIRDFPPYQEVQSQTIQPPDYTLVIDEYGNHYA